MQGQKVAQSPWEGEEKEAGEERNRYSYVYPRNLLSWFFLAQRHRYVRSILHNSVNLDVGCSVHKITTTSIGLDLRREKRPDVVCSALSLPFADGSFDTCTILEVMEHMDRERQAVALTEAHRVLRRGGQLVISTPNLVHGLFNLVWWFWERTGGRQWLHEHVGMADPQEVEGLLASCGFSVRSSERVAVFDRIIDAACLK